MRATGSTRTGMRWWSYSGKREAVSGKREPIALAAILLLLCPLSACVTQTSSYFVPTPGQSRYSADDARDELDAVLRAECPRLLAADRPTGAAELDVDLGRTGDVARARISRPSGDAQMDRVFGAVAARMHFQAPPAAEMKGETIAGHLRMGFSCSKGGAAVATVEIL